MTTTDTFLIALGKYRMAEIFANWFREHPIAISHGIAEEDLYNEVIPCVIGKTTCRTILLKAGYHIKTITNHIEGIKCNFVVSKDYVKRKSWIYAWNNRYIPNSTFSPATDNEEENEKN